MIIADDMMADLHVFDKIQQITLQLKKGNEARLKVNGKVQMKNRQGHSIVESMFFMTEAILFLQ
jgi:hypothetical protein